MFYDSKKDASFREAVTDYAKQARDAFRGAITGDWLEVAAEREAAGTWHEYGMYVEDGSSSVEVIASSCERIDGLTEAAARLIWKEMSESSARRGGVAYTIEEVRRAHVDVLTRRAFFVQLDTGDISMRTDFGYAVDGMEMLGAGSAVDEFEAGREKMFGRDDLEEFARAVAELGLVDEERRAQFLRRF